MSSGTVGKVLPLLGWLLAAVLLALIVLSALGPLKFLGTIFSSSTESRDVSVVNAVTTEEQVVLLSLGIQGLMEESAQTELLGFALPGTDRTTFIQYSFNARLGLDGEQVTIEKVTDDEFLITIPEFIFIGHDNETFSLAVEDNGILSWMTPDVDELAMVNNILNNGSELEYIEANADLLRAQAASFYRGIVTSIDPDLSVTFDFADGGKELVTVGN